MSVNPKGQNGKKKVGTILAILVLLPFLGLLIYAFFISPKSPFAMIFTKNRFDTSRQIDQATIYYESQQWDKAQPALEELVEKKPNDEMVHYMLGMTYARRGYPDKAETELKKSLELKPDFYPASASLASLYLRLGIDRAERMDKQQAASYLAQAQTQIQKALELVTDESEKEMYIETQKQINDEMNKL